MKEITALHHGKQPVKTLERMAIHWKKVAFQLDLGTDRVGIIEENYSKNIEGACMKMIEEWLKREGEKATWRKLIAAINTVEDLHVLADDLRKALS